MAHRRLKAQNAGILERIFGIELRSIYEEFTEENVSGADRYVPMETLLILAARLKALLDIWPVLPKETQIFLKGKYILGYTDQELACQLKCKPSSIRMKLTRARRAALLLLSERNEVKEHDKT